MARIKVFSNIQRLKNVTFHASFIFSYKLQENVLLPQMNKPRKTRHVVQEQRIPRMKAVQKVLNLLDQDKASRRVNWQIICHAGQEGRVFQVVGDSGDDSVVKYREIKTFK